MVAIPRVEKCKELDLEIDITNIEGNLYRPSSTPPSKINVPIERSLIEKEYEEKITVILLSRHNYFIEIRFFAKEETNNDISRTRI